MQDNKTPINKQGERHGYWEVYRNNGTLAYQRNYINGNLLGYSVNYLQYGKITSLMYHAR